MKQSKLKAIMGVVGAFSVAAGAQAAQQNPVDPKPAKEARPKLSIESLKAAGIIKTAQAREAVWTPGDRPTTK